MPMLIAEDLLLLLTDDETGKLLASSSQVDVALGGAILVELAQAHRVAVSPDTGRLVVVDASSAADGLLDEALATLAGKESTKPKDAVTALGKGLRPRLDARLAERGLLREESGRILGLFPTHRWPALGDPHEDSVRAQLVLALRTGATGDLRVAALVSLLHALRLVAKVVDPRAAELPKKELKAAAGRIAEGDWASEAVRRAIDDAIATTAAATLTAAGS